MSNPFLAYPTQQTSLAKRCLNYLLVVAAALAFIYFSLQQISYQLDFGFLPAVSGRIFDGLWLTLLISAASLIASLVAGFLLAAAQSSRILPLRYFADFYVKIIRGTPLMAQIYLFYYIVGTAWQITNRFAAAVIILSIFEAAYIAEILRGSLLSLDENQLEAARAVGFTPAQSFRFVILPQLAARTLPALTGQFASIIKDSSLLSLIAVIELSQTMREISATNFRLFECYFLLAALYLALTLPISLISRYFEKKMNYVH